MKKHYIIPVFVPHLGCPHDCVFCNQSNITGQDRKDAEKINYDYVLKTADEYLSTMDRENATVELSFFGGTFTAIEISVQRDLLKAAKKLKDEGKIDLIRCSTRPDYIDFDEMVLLKNYGMNTIELGVQSLDDEVLIESGRGHDKKSVELASKMINDWGFTLGHQIMPGLPKDSFEKVVKTVEESIAMAPKEVRLYPSLVIKDTKMEEMYRDGSYTPLSLEEAVKITALLYRMYTANGIKVIRCGLQPTENLSYDRDLIAGPFHSAFGELVTSFIINEDILSLIRENLKYNEEGKILEENNNINILISNKSVSKLYADGKRYFNHLKDELKKDNILSNVKVTVSEKVSPNDIEVEQNGRKSIIKII